MERLLAIQEDRDVPLVRVQVLESRPQYCADCLLPGSRVEGQRDLTSDDSANGQSQREELPFSVRLISFVKKGFLGRKKPGLSFSFGRM